jgi:cell division protein FtsN
VSAGQRISARDYKHGGGRRGRFDARAAQHFGMGLALGLALAVVVFVLDHRDQPADAEVAQTKPGKQAAAATAVADESTEDYDYYDMLSKVEVTLPEERMRRDQPAEPITERGSYVIQAGSFVNEAQALRRQQQLAKLDITAAVQRVAIDADVKHRVRIGPVTDLKRLNEIRSLLRKADVDLLISKLPD